MKAHKIYRKAIRHHMAPFFPNWVPGTPNQLGQFGRMKEGTFVAEGNIKDHFGIDFEIHLDASGEPYQFSSGGNVKVGFNAAADAGAIGNASLKLEFEKKHTVFVQALESSVHRIKNKRQVFDKLLAGFKDGSLAWKRNYVLVTDILIGGRVVVAVTGESGGEINFSAQADVEASQIPFDASIGLNMSTSNMAAYNTTGQQMPLCLGLSRIRGWFRQDFEGLRSADTKSADTSPEAEEYQFEQLSGKDWSGEEE